MSNLAEKNIKNEDSVKKQAESPTKVENSTPEEEKQPKKKRVRKKRLKGFAGLLHGIMNPLNENGKFKHVYRDADLKILLVALDMAPAALLTIDHSTLAIEEVPFKKPSDLKGVKRDGLLQCTLQQFMGIASGKLNPATAWIKRKLKIRGPRKLLKLLPLFSMVKF